MRRTSSVSARALGLDDAIATWNFAARAAAVHSLNSNDKARQKKRAEAVRVRHPVLQPPPVAAAVPLARADILPTTMSVIVRLGPARFVASVSYTHLTLPTKA